MDPLISSDTRFPFSSRDGQRNPTGRPPIPSSSSRGEARRSASNLVGRGKSLTGGPLIPTAIDKDPAKRRGLYVVSTFQLCLHRTAAFRLRRLFEAGLFPPIAGRGFQTRGFPDQAWKKLTSPLPTRNTSGLSSIREMMLDGFPETIPPSTIKSRVCPSFSLIS